MLDASTMVAPHPRVVFRPLDGQSGGVVLHLGSAAYHGVNAIGALILSEIEDGPTFGTLVERVRGELADAPPELESDVAEFLTALAARDLVLIGGAATVSA